MLPAEILGQVYEQFLGKVIRLTAGHQAKVEEKPEVKKAGGVYYTPTYIVDYIVKHTVGKLLEGKTPKEAARLTILDPACGSGSFLLGAYRHLLDWHLQQYEEDGPEKHTKELFQAAGGAWRLTTAEKKRILLEQHLRRGHRPAGGGGHQASLLLKVLEGESQQTLETQREAVPRARPARPGRQHQVRQLADRAGFLRRANRRRCSTRRSATGSTCFDWNAEFPEIMKAGGFDAVIGNPPYVRQESLSGVQRLFRASTTKPSTAWPICTPTSWRRASSLLRDGGLFSIIVSSSFLRATYGESLRGIPEETCLPFFASWISAAWRFSPMRKTPTSASRFSAKAQIQQPVEVSKVDSMEIKNLSEHVAANFYTIPHERLSPKRGRSNPMRSGRLRQGVESRQAAG